MRPGRRDGGEERAALRRRLQVALARGLEGGGEFDDGEKAGVVLRRRRRRQAWRNRIASLRPAPWRRMSAIHVAKRVRRRDAAVLDRPLQAVAVGVGADRKRRRQPRQQHRRDRLALRRLRDASGGASSAGVARRSGWMSATARLGFVVAVVVAQREVVLVVMVTWPCSWPWWASRRRRRRRLRDRTLPRHGARSRRGPRPSPR